MNSLKTIKVQAKASIKSIILPEALDPRVLEATQRINQKKLAKPILIGNPQQISQVARHNQIDIADITIINPVNYSETTTLETNLRQIYQVKNKSITEQQIQSQMTNPLYFSALLLKDGLADGCVAGAANPTVDVLRAGFNVLGTMQGVKTISGAFIMELQDKILIFADCAVVIDPTAEQLVDIAVASGKTAKTLLNIEPKIAMLSFTTKGNVKHQFSGKVAEATDIAKEKLSQKNLNFVLDGELQLDAALVPEVAKVKAPESQLEGNANVLVFPNLDAGNIGYKLVQRLGGANAIGPIIQGIAKPMNDLSRGASVDDIVNMVAITSVQSLTHSEHIS